MNPDTLVVVHCYAGDRHQVVNALPQYQHHECPVLVLSPEDAPVHIDGVMCRSAGKRAYIGQDSLDRQRAHLELLFEYEWEWVLLHDSDSVCLEPMLPDYLHQPDALGRQCLWYNPTPTIRFLEEVGQPGFEGYPEVYQPPLFTSRAALERMLAVSDKAMESLPEFAKLIDWYFVAMAREAGITARALPDGISRPIWSEYELARTYAMVRTRGFTMIHSVKTPQVLSVLVSGRAEFNRDPEGLELCRSW